jgi:hypothetical protein
MGKSWTKEKGRAYMLGFQGSFLQLKSTNRWGKYYTAADYTDITTQLYSRNTVLLTNEALLIVQ